jgi:hypothetical protein
VEHHFIVRKNSLTPVNWVLLQLKGGVFISHTSDLQIKRGMPDLFTCEDSW